MKPSSYNFSYYQLLVIFGDDSSYSESTTFRLENYDITLINILDTTKNKSGFIIKYKNIPLTVRVTNKTFSISRGPDDIQTIHTMDEKDIEDICNEFISMTLEYMRPEQLVTWLKNIRTNGIEDGKRVIKERMRNLFD